MIFWNIFPLGKLAYSNMLKIWPPKKWKFSDEKYWYFSYFCSKHRLWVLVRTTYWGSSNEYPQSMFLSRNKKNNVYPCKPQFYYIELYKNVIMMLLFFFFQKISFQKRLLISVNNKKNINSLSSVEFAHSVLCVKCHQLYFTMKNQHKNKMYVNIV